METRNTGDTNNPNPEWISEENRDKQVQGATEEQIESLSAAEANYDNPNDERLFADASGNDGDDDDDDDADEEDDNEKEDANDDWGTVDPLDPPGSLPDPMDPSGPGSAV